MRYNAHGLLYKVKVFHVPRKPPQKGECHPPHEPSDMARRMVIACVTNGFSQKRIAAMLDIHEETLRKHYRYELDTGFDGSIARATDRLLGTFVFSEEMLERDPKVVQTAIQFLLNTKGGWKQQAETTNTHAVKSEIVHQLDNLSLDQLLQAGEGIKRMKGE
jgi:hypothetical protein